MSCIAEILKLKGDKDALVPPGNWIALEGGGKYKDYEYLIVLNKIGHRCGYVAIPPEHKYSEIPMQERALLSSDRKFPHWDYVSLDIQCHGGLTFMSPDHGLKKLLPVACTDMWIGFDCGHCYDMCDVEAYRKYFGAEQAEAKLSFFAAMNHGFDGQHVKNYDYVEQECWDIIEQLIQAA